MKTKPQSQTSVLAFLATTLNIRSEVPNQELAVEIIKSNRNDWVEELAQNLQNKDKRIQSDCIKVLYEIGERGSAEMIAPFWNDFELILKSKNNRLVWGAMSALETITLYVPQEIFSFLDLIVHSINSGSVITIDRGVGVLAKLASIGDYCETVFPLLLEQLQKCPSKQLPMYAEKSVIAINTANKKQFIDLLQSRLPEMNRETQVKRIEKVIKKVSK